MEPLRRASTAAWLSIAVMLLVVLAPTGSVATQQAALQQAGSLTVSPGLYVGGQRMLFEGNLGVTGERRIGLQFHMNRPGDDWNDVEGFSSRTAANGSFSFAHPAPSMFGIRMRVVSGNLATTPWTFDAKSQDLVVTVDAGLPGLAENQVVAGLPFTFHVDTTPEDLTRRPDLPAPAIQGRELSLQKRVAGGRWVELETTTTDFAGEGSFEWTVDPIGTTTRTVESVLAFRVVQEDWTAGGNDIGWFPSFPVPVEVLASVGRQGATQRTTSSLTTRPEADVPPSTVPGLRSGAAATASQTHGWAPSLWDFAWEYGESLTSPPARGTDRRGGWLDTSDGTGRAAKHNGGLMLDSQRDYSGPGDRGTTAVTLHGNPMAYGRWEAKMRLKSTESNARDYHAVIELVPSRARDYKCGAQNITVADVPVGGSTVGVGVKTLSRDRQWTRTVRFEVGTTATAFAVEVTKRHISWFVNGRVIGTVQSRAAVSDVPMTLRLSLVGGGPDQEMNKTQFISDWQRGFSLDRGRKVTSGDSLKRGTHGGGC